MKFFVVGLAMVAILDAKIGLCMYTMIITSVNITLLFRTTSASEG